jgi:hypothetical protein
MFFYFFIFQKCNKVASTTQQGVDIQRKAFFCTPQLQWQLLLPTSSPGGDPSIGAT